MSDIFEDTENDGAASGNARGGIQALDAALVVLRALADLDGPVALIDLARAVSMPSSKVHRYLASFIHAGLVKQMAKSGRYELGLSAATLGLAALARNDVVSLAADELSELAEQTGMTVLLSVWGNNGATVIRWCRAPSPMVTSFGLGSTLPLLTSASGRILLAFLPRQVTAARLRLEVERALESGLTWPDLDLSTGSVEKVIETIRTARFATIDGRFVPGLRAVAAPITNWQGEAEAAVTLISTSEQILSAENLAVQALLDFVARFSSGKQ
ncbi:MULTISPECIES: IclR family transcriptional regulator [Agrobacterium]|uniref:Acetate operon repressor n=1 Tax=Agrobacterium rosae TaxID=1972867 RepID=A0A1R3U5F2_9HYPH|nr:MULTISPECIES: IclR family transcriptional regulator [Agrobacterium]SCX22597.1 Acetate operon repressor [Agrobacterium sp. DSM 25558]SCX35279.1 Acetate operon repressor [Agrobacterium rosae]